MRRFISVCLAMGGMALVGAVPAPAANQNTSLVIEGGTLVDGRGGAPLIDSAIVIEGNRITAVGRRGQIARPTGAQIIHATGKYITPGLIDTKSNYASMFGEAYLIWGVTTAVISGGSHDAGNAERDAIEHGIFPGPRIVHSFGVISAGAADSPAPPGAPLIGGMASSPDDARARVAALNDAGANIIQASNGGNGSPETYRAMVEEADRRGMAALIHNGAGNTFLASHAARAGFDVLIHAGAAGNELAADPEKWRDYRDRRPDPYSDMDDAKVPGIIQVLLANDTALEPDLMAMGRGFPKNWARVRREVATFFDDPALRAYYSKVHIAGLVENAKPPETYLTPALYEVRKRGFTNYTRFLKMVVDAGGHILAASDIPETVPGLGVHQEIALFQEDVGLSPMQALMSATSWPAHHLKLDDRGTVETGKLADLIIADADPTRDILNLRKINTVIKDGKVVDRIYHADYLDRTFKIGMYEDGTCCFGSPSVESAAGPFGGWVRALKQTTWRPDATNGEWALAGGIDSELSPTPAIEAIAPYVFSQGAENTTVTIRGFNFVSKSQVLIDGKTVPAKVVSRTEVQIPLEPEFFANAGRHTVYVRNPEPLATKLWGDTSNAAKLLVTYPFTTRTSQNKL